MSKGTHRVYVHVGVPKSGTTFLQASLSEHRKALRSAGVLYPAGPPERMIRAALDVRGNHRAWGRSRKEVAGSWDALSRKARRYAGTTVLSHELLGAATSRQAEQALSMLEGLDVHVVVTARDIARQVTAEWQEGVKHGRKASFATFSERLSSYDPAHKHAQRFWASQELPGVLSRWGGMLPPDHVHVVCCPPRSASRDVLWQRFAEVVGFDGERFPGASRISNSSLGAVQVHLLRKVNAALDGRLAEPAYGRIVKQHLAERLLVRHDSPRPELPLAMYGALVDVAERWVKEIDRLGYTVHGDLQELVPSTPLGVAADPDDVDAELELATAAAVIADLLVERSAALADR